MVTGPDTSKEEWEVKVLYWIPTMKISPKFTYKEILCEDAFSSLIAAIEAVERYVSLRTSEDAYHNNKMGLFQYCAKEGAAYILGAEYEWHESPFGDNLWSYHVSGMPLNYQVPYPYFLVTRRS